MLNIAIVEDSPADADRLRSYLLDFSTQHGVAFNIDVFVNPMQFLNEYQPVADIVFLDIELPDMNGLDAARRLRAIDEDVILFFVTNMAQFATRGYEVAAFDYIVKPVSYASLERKLKRAVAQRRHASSAILIPQRAGAKRILLRDISYIEVRGHTLLFFTDSGMVTGSGTLQDTERRLAGPGFIRCAKAFLVNHRRIASVKGTTVVLDDGRSLVIGRAYRTGFMQSLADRIGDGNSA